MAKKEILRFDFYTGKKIVESSMFAIEKPVKVYINRELFCIFFASPEMEEELVIGHMLSEGVITTVNDVKRINISDKEGIDVKLREGLLLPRAESNVDKLTTAGFMARARANTIETSHNNSELRVEADYFRRMVEIVENKNRIHKATRGCHLAAIFTKKADLISFSEDVGRHNAVDKVIGAVAFRSMDFSKLILLSSGRQSAHMVMKAMRVGIPIILTLAYPLESGLKVAEKAGITLLHFRKRFLKVFTSPERIKWSQS